MAAQKQMSLRMDDELWDRLNERLGTLMQRETWVRELVRREIENPVHMPAGENHREESHEQSGRP